MGSRIVMVNGIPVLAEDDPLAADQMAAEVTRQENNAENAAFEDRQNALNDLANAQLQAQDVLAAGGGPTPGVNAPDIIDPMGGKIAPPAATPVADAIPAIADAGGRVGDVVQGAGAAVAGAAGSAPPPEPAVSSSPDDAVDAAGNVLSAAGDTAVDFAKSALTPYGIAGPPPAPPPETPDEYEARLNGTWERLAATLPMVPAEQRLDHIQEMGRVAEELKGIYAQRGVGAAQDVAAEQMRLQKEAQAKAAEVEKAAAERKAAIEADVKKQRDHALKLDEDAANAKIDRSWNPGGTANGIMLAISVAMAGLGSALKHQGDRNPALDILLKQVDARVEDQWKKKRETHDWAKGQIDRLDVYRNDTLLSEDQAKERAKIALLKDYADQIKNVASTMPSAKRAALDATVAAAMDRVTAMEGAWDAEAYRRAVKDREDAEKKRASMADEANARIQARAAASNAQTARLRFKFDEKQWNDPVARRQREADADKARADADKAIAEAKDAPAKKAAEDAKAKAEADLAQIRTENAAIDQQIKSFMPSLKRDANGNVIMEKGPDGVMRPKVSFGLLLDTSGNPVKPKDRAGEARHVDDLMSSYRQINGLIDELTRMIEANGGWDSKLLDTDEYKQKLAKFQALSMENISTFYSMGVPNGKDDERAQALYGGDPNKFRSAFGIGDPRAGLRSMRDTAESKMHNYLLDHTTYDGPQSGVHIPEQTNAGFMKAIKNTPAEELMRAAEGRFDESVTHRDGSTTDFLKSNWDPSLGAGTYNNPAGAYAGPNPAGVPTPEAYDAIQKAADIAAGKASGDPEAAKKMLRAIIVTEDHGPAWQLAAKMAFDDNIDLADGLGGLNDFFTPQAYRVAAKTGSPEVMRMLYGQDPTYGYGGTEEARAEHKKRAGIQVTGAEVAPFARMFIPGAPGAADAERILRLTPRR